MDFIAAQELPASPLQELADIRKRHQERRAAWPADRVKPPRWTGRTGQPDAAGPLGSFLRVHPRDVNVGL